MLVGVQKKFQMANINMLNKNSSMKCAVKSVPGLTDVGAPHGVEDGPITPPRCLEGVWKNFQMTYFTMPNNISSTKSALKSVPGLADVGVPHGDGDGSRTPAPGSGSKIDAYHVDQWVKLKWWGG